MDMKSTLFKDSTFDGIWTCASFMHIPKRQAGECLSEFGRIIAPGGLLYVTVMEGEKERIWGGRLFSDYQESELVSILENSGFHPVETFFNHCRNNPKFKRWINVFARAKE